MSKYYEVVDISQKPDKEGWYDLIDPNGTYGSESRYFSKGHWFESAEHAENEHIDEDDAGVEGLYWLREVDHLPLSREQADPSVLVDALQNIKYACWKKTDQPGLIKDIQIINELANKAITTYKESKPSPSIARQQAEKVWDAAIQYQQALNQYSDEYISRDEFKATPNKEECLKQFDKQ